jgi:hypothetical protein
MPLGFANNQSAESAKVLGFLIREVSDISMLGGTYIIGLGLKQKESYSLWVLRSKT